jgi:hypothetical protein
MDLSGQIGNTAAMLTALALLAALTPGIYTNEDDHYFARERSDPVIPAWTGIEVGADNRWRRVDWLGQPLTDWAAGDPPGLVQAADGTARLHTATGQITTVKRGEAFTCWVSVLKTARKPDGKEDWTFQANLKTHDMGGRVAGGGAALGAPGVVLRVRNVVWPPPATNRPSLVLYVHTPDEPNRAVSYSWADPAAKLIGINLRWVQGSCTRGAR